ncbi:hypothetical protein Dimus_023497 [Dionaea muscipula]
MPRPGPRPYECVRRAWHSDRHRPIRGSIIQQIFRVVNEAHSSATRKNREWQEKLPIVVLKAEEIMYSKANSEAEYMNPDTLWDRLNDAVDTIIRRDESTETGQLLQPCIEAALVLGCVPVRASRSERSNIRRYLTPRAQEALPVVAPVVSERINNQRPTPTPHPSHPSCHQTSMPKPAVANHHPNHASGSDSHIPPNFDSVSAHNVPILRPNVLPGIVTSIPFDSSTAMRLGSVYPLYYGAHFRPLDPHPHPHPHPHFGFQLRLQNSNSDNVFIGMPIGWSPAAEPAHFVGTTRNLFPCDNVANAADKLRQENTQDDDDDDVKASEIDCDLSLRLGLISEPKFVAREIGDDGGASRCNFLESSSQNQEFCFFPRGNADDPSESYAGKLSAEGEVQGIAASLGKRKVPICQDDDLCARWQNQFSSRNRWPGLYL